MTPDTPAGVAAELALRPEEAVVLTALRYRMMQRDIAAERSAKALLLKRPTRDAFRRDAVAAVTGLVDAPPGAAGSPPPITPWLLGFAQQMTALAPAERYALLEDSPTALSGHLSERSRSLLILIDLHGFEPWPRTGWMKKVREQSLRDARNDLPGLRPEDLDGVAAAYASVLRQLRRASVSWGRVLLLTGAGLGLGVLTAGFAAPLIGGAVGTVVLGYSGAAATSAGLALLGGGSLAAGGLGMAGGTALLVGVGGAAGVGLAAGGGRATGFTAGQVIADAVRLEVVTKLVLIDSLGDDEAARKVVEGLHQRIGQLRERAVELAGLVTDLRAEVDAAKQEAKAHREDAGELAARVAELEEQLAAAKQSQKGVELSQTALEVVTQRLGDVA